MLTPQSDDVPGGGPEGGSSAEQYRGTSSSAALSEEQRARIEANRQMAIERKRQRTTSDVAADAAPAVASLSDPEFDMQDAIDQECGMMTMEVPVASPAAIPFVAASASVPQPLVRIDGCLRKRHKRLTVKDDFIMVGSAAIHVSHSVRFNGAYFWCEKCAYFTTGAAAKLLHFECRKTLKNATAKHMHGRLCKGLTPLKQLLPVEGVDGNGRVLLAIDSCGRHALQMYSP